MSDEGAILNETTGRTAVDRWGRPLTPRPVKAPGTEPPVEPPTTTPPPETTPPPVWTGAADPLPTPALPIDRNTPFRGNLDCGLEVWLQEHERLASPIPKSQQHACYLAVKPWSAQCLAFGVKESELGKTAAAGSNNFLNLFVDGGGPKMFPSWEACAKEWYARFSDPQYKPSFPGVYMPRTISVEQAIVTFQGGPGCWDSKGGNCSHGETWKPCQGGSAASNSIELSVQQFVARVNTYMGHPQTVPWSPVPGAAGCGGTTPPSSPVTEQDVLNLISNNTPGVYVSFDYAERNVGHPIYAYGKGHGAGLVSNEHHPGIDIWMPDETPVNAVFGGEVVCVGAAGRVVWGQGCGYFSDDDGGLGNITILTDAHATIDGKRYQLKMTYGHMSSAVVQVGQRIANAERIGRSGVAASWPHIHLDVVINAPALNNPQIWNNPGEYHLVDPLPTILNAIGAEGSGELVFGRVPKPAWTDRVIPDYNNRCWDNLGDRGIKGVVLHRQQGNNWGTDSYFRSVPNGGSGACPPPGSQWVHGGCNGLTDFGIDRNSGEALLWNDFLGKPSQGVTADRSPWASGPYKNPGGDGSAFVAKYGVNAINRDLPALEVDGDYADPVAEAGRQKVAAVVAYLADQAKVPHTNFPINPHTGLTFYYWHNEFCGKDYKSCPGAVVEQITPDLIARTKAILKRHQTGA